MPRFDSYPLLFTSSEHKHTFRALEQQHYNFGQRFFMITHDPFRSLRHRFPILPFLLCERWR